MSACDALCGVGGIEAHHGIIWLKILSKIGWNSRRRLVSEWEKNEDGQSEKERERSSESDSESDREEDAESDERAETDPQRYLGLDELSEGVFEGLTGS